MTTVEQSAATTDLIQAVLRRLLAENSEPSAHLGAELDYANDAILDAARRLVAATSPSKGVVLAAEVERLRLVEQRARELAKGHEEGGVAEAFRRAAICILGEGRS